MVRERAKFSRQLMNVGRIQKVVHGRVPEQRDGWSCGHRNVLILKFLLKLMKEQKLNSMVDLEVPEHVVSEDAIQSLCSHGAVDCPQKMIKSEPAKVERKAPAASAAHPATVKKVEQESMESRQKHQKQRAKPKEDPPLPPPAAPPAEEPDASLSATKNESKACKADMADEAASPPQMDAALVEKVDDILEKRQSKKQQQRVQNDAKKLLKQCGLDFNKHFQTAHKRMRLESGHWKTFLLGVQGEGNIDCEICQKLVLDFKIDRVARKEASEEELTATPQKQPRSTCQDLVLVGPTDTLESPPKKRARAGRPRKAEERPTFDLKSYLEEKRPGMYRFLEAEEATSRLGKSSPNVDAIMAEMSKHPVQCMQCGVFLHFPYLTNSLALSAHEKSRPHQDALKQEALTKRGSKCKGLCLPKFPNTLLYQKLDELQKWYNFECICVVPSILDVLTVAP